MASPLVLRWKWAILRSPLPSRAKLVCLVIGLHMDSSGRNAFPSANTLATLCSCDRSTVFRWLKAAEEEGFLERVRRYNASNIYRPRFPASTSQIPDSTSPEEGVAQCDGVVSNLPPSRSQIAHTTSSLTSSLTSPPTYAGASASLPDGSQPLRKNESWVCPKCGVEVFPKRGACGYCDHSWADDESGSERQRAGEHPTATTGSSIRDLTTEEMRRVGTGRRKVDT